MAVEDGLTATKLQTTELTDDQTRLRQNLDSLNRVKGQEDQVRTYFGQLADNEAQLARLRDQRRELAARKTSLDAQIKDAIDRLNF